MKMLPPGSTQVNHCHLLLLCESKQGEYPQPAFDKGGKPKLDGSRTVPSLGNTRNIHVSSIYLLLNQQQKGTRESGGRRCILSKKWNGLMESCKCTRRDWLERERESNE